MTETDSETLCHAHAHKDVSEVLCGTEEEAAPSVMPAWSSGICTCLDPVVASGCPSSRGLNLGLALKRRRCRR